ncbi:MAG: tetratricopeptide repeat protein, partial [Pseudomonadales bacterium]|nr:tetratricopeptide repeat protein [Pseudomonadales bacterium]
PTGNVNLIEAGHSLVIPPVDEIRRLGAREAALAVEEQDQSWRSGRKQSSVAAKPLEAAQINTAPHQAKPEAPVASARGQVHLVAPGQAGKSKLAAADAELARANEKKTQAEQLENAHLKAQIDSDQAKLQSQQAQLALQDKKLAELQAAMKAQPQSHQAQHAVVELTPLPVVAVKPALAPVMSHPVVAVVANKPAPTTTAVIKAKPVSIPPQPVAKPDVTPPSPNLEPAAATGGVNFLAWGVGGIAALAALVGGLIAFRRHRDQSAEANRLSTNDMHAFEHDEPVFTSLHDDHGDMDDFAMPAQALDEVSEAPYDALQEAEDFLSRGRYPQAAGILTRAIEQEPERSDLRLRLMECQVAMGDAEGFAEQEHALEDMGDLDALDHAEKMRDQLPVSSLGKLSSTQSEEGVIDFTPTKPSADARAEAGMNDESLEDMEFDFNQSLSQTQLHAVDDQLLEKSGLPEGDLELPPLDLELPPLDLESDDGFKVQSDSDIDLKSVSLPSDEHHDVFSFDPVQESAPVATSSLPFDADELASAPLHDAPKADEDAALDLGELVLDEDAPVSADASLEGLEGDDLHDLDFSLDDLEQASSLPDHEAPLEGETLALEDEEDLTDMDFDLESLEPLDQVPGVDEEVLGHDELADPLVEVSNHQVDREELHGIDSVEAEHAQLDDGLDADFESMDLDAMSLEDFAALESPSAEYDLSVVEPEIAVAAEQDSGIIHDELMPQVEPEPVDENSLDLGDDFDFLADADENATKLDLAKAYMDMGDVEGARDILQEVLAEGSSQQQEEARGLLLQAS